MLYVCISFIKVDYLKTVIQNNFVHWIKSTIKQKQFKTKHILPPLTPSENIYTEILKVYDSAKN